MKQGAIDLDIDEAFIEVDEKGNAVDVYPDKRGLAEKIIEDFMLCANKSVAEYIYHTGVPGIYRVHDEPDKEKLDAFIRFASLLGYKIRLSKQRYSAQLNDFVESISGSDEEFLLKKILLRCMKKAEYRADSTSHFALAFMYYTHFTSPIRRYPDLTVHRILSKIAGGTVTPEYIEYLNAHLPQTAYDCSRCERRAEEAQREGDKIKIAQYMAKHKGAIFEGIISSVVNFGIFVQLSNMAEGLVRFADIQDDYYTVDLERLQAVGQRTKRVLKVGGRVFAQVFKVNRENGEIDLLLIDEDEVEGFED
jgi:ribonuclease R